MEVFGYFRIKKDDSLSTKLLLSKRHLWRDIEEEQFTEAIEELIGRGYIGRLESPEGWRLREARAEYLKQIEKKRV